MNAPWRSNNETTNILRDGRATSDYDQHGHFASQDDYGDDNCELPLQLADMTEIRCVWLRRISFALLSTGFGFLKRGIKCKMLVAAIYVTG